VGLKSRIIPVILHRGAQAIKGKQFDGWRSVGSVMNLVRVHARRGVDEIALLDVGATPEGRGPDFDLIRQLAGELLSPLTVGGGITSISDFREALRSGADKVCIGSAAISDPDLISRAAERFGRQAVCVAIDVRGGAATSQGRADNAVGFGEVHINCGRTPTGLCPIEFAKQCEHLGAGELLLTSIDRDGMLCGYDLGLVREVSRAVGIPVVAAGGAGSYNDLADGLRAGAHAVAAGALWQFCDAIPAEAAEYLSVQGFAVRRDHLRAEDAKPVLPAQNLNVRDAHR
jgi:cyclase